MAAPTPWAEAVALRGRWFKDAAEEFRPSLETRPASDVAAWVVDLEGEVERYADRAAGRDEGDPREALVRLLAVAGAAIDAMRPTT